MSNRTILISGLGIAGPTLSFWLKAGGFEPTLIERSPRLRTGGYVIDFWGLGHDIAERMGLRKISNASVIMSKRCASWMTAVSGWPALKLTFSEN